MSEEVSHNLEVGGARGEVEAREGGPRWHCLI